MFYGPRHWSEKRAADVKDSEFISAWTFIKQKMQNNPESSYINDYKPFRKGDIEKFD